MAGCKNPNTDGDESSANCHKIQTGARVYYEGNASQEQKQAMFQLLTDTVLAQASAGSFADVGEVRSVEASSSSSGGSSGAGMPIGIAVGVVVVGALAGMFYYKKRKIVTAGEKGLPDTSDDDSVVHAHAVVVDDDTQGKKKDDSQEVKGTFVDISK